MKSRDRDVQPAVDAGTLFREHAGFVGRFLLRLGAPEQDVMDLVQEVFVTAHRRGGFVPGKAKASTWLAEIALRVASNSRRTRRRHPERPDDGAVLAVVAEKATPADAAETSQALDRVQRALDALDLDKRAAFVLYELEGESCEAIAEALGVPIGTIYSRLHTARRQFAEAHARLLERAAPAGAWKKLEGT